ncbi:MAG: glycosyltransferase family 4 protein [Opitutales bacterium]
MARFLFLTQVYPPDPAAVGQYLADAAEALVQAGHTVTVLTARAGFDDPSVRYAPRETRNGVTVIRLPGTSFGKRNLIMRLLGATSFLAQALVRPLFGGRIDRIVATTAPPMGGFGAWLLASLKRTSFAWWVMDINPDQAVRLGAFGPRHPAVRVFDWANRRVLPGAHRVIALDPHMAATLRAKVPLSDDRLKVIPPWSMDDHLEPVPSAKNPFRAEHGLDGQRVILYSGNHSPAHPLDTLFRAIPDLDPDDGLRFLFIGGGKHKADIAAFFREHPSPQVQQLPYQPLDRIRYSLSAGDVHVVSLGPPMVGVVHPCKVYGALALGKPLLFIGPTDSHVGEILDATGCGWRIEPGDTHGMEQVLHAIADLPEAELAAMGQRGAAYAQKHLSQAILIPRLVAELTDGVPHEPPRRHERNAD